MLSSSKNGNTIEKKKWYAGSMSRDEAEKILFSRSYAPGTYLVRYSTHKNRFVLSSFRVDHYLIYHDDKTTRYYLFPFPFFPTLRALLDHYKQASNGLPCKLEKGCREAGERRKEKDDIKRQRIDQIDFEIEPNSLLPVANDHIGSGHFGLVTKKQWKTKTGNKVVAVKTIQEGSERDNQKFLEEIKLLTKLSHPHLVALFGMCTKTRPYQIVMEFMKNGALSRYLRDHKTELTYTTLLYMGIQIADGMSYLETKQMCHRDLRADNVLVGEHNIVKITDFGLARILNENEYTVNNFEFPLKWTDPYAIESRTFTSKSDVWSFGILLTELVTYGRKPYLDMKNHDAYSKTLTGYRMAKPKDCPLELYEGVMLWCWDKDAKKRPTFAELKTTLSKFFNTEHIYCRQHVA